MKEHDTIWKPINDQIMTRWVKDISHFNVLPEYPRPQLVRDKWMCLNGLWAYTIRPRKETNVDSFKGNILVPFPIESALSGVKKKLTPKKRLWYRISFTIPSEWIGKKILLHFGAVDWEAQVFVNGHEVGIHRGGYTPFTFDITDYLSPNNKAFNELKVAVWDPTDKGKIKQERGKQSLTPRFAFYSAISGIWQTVWLEPVPDTYIDKIKITPDIDKKQLALEVMIKNHQSGDQLEVVIDEKSFKPIILLAKETTHFDITIEDLKLWTPELPYLYNFRVLLKRKGVVVDQIKSYFAMRKISIGKDEKGIPRIFLNNEKIFQYGPLDQGYWPDGLYTPPTYEALRHDVEIMKEMGFNMVRKHVKVEPERWYYYCDKLGLLVWQDMPNGGNFSILTYKWEINQGRGNKKSREQFKRELTDTIDHLYNHPCIIMWVPFNEGWGQFDTEEVVGQIAKLDRSRLINEASGWFNKGTGHIRDIHKYPGPSMPPIEEERVAVLGEFGGLGLKVENHSWIPNKILGLKRVYWSYSRSKDSNELMEKYEKLIDQLKDLIPKGLSAAVYTQLTDVEGEVNGYLTYDREIIKFGKEKLRKLHQEVIKSL